MYGRFLKADLEKRSSWAVPWMLSLQSHELISILPRINLVSSQGHGQGGTHTDGFTYDQYLFVQTHEMPFPLIHPTMVARDEKADRLYELRTFSLVPRALTVFGLKTGIFGHALCSLAHQVERVLPALFRL